MPIDVTEFDWDTAVKNKSISFSVFEHRDQNGNPTAFRQRSFGRGPHKGLSLVPYDPNDKNSELIPAEKSIYRWWYEFLRLSQDYWFLCQMKEEERQLVQDPQFIYVFKKFGDIFNQDFDTWWKKKGQYIFAERKLLRVREIDLSNPTLAPPTQRRQTKESTEKITDHRMIVEIPVSLTSREVTDQIREILRKYRSRRPENRFGTSSAVFPIAGPKKMVLLKMICTLYALKHELIATNQNSRFKAFSIGNALLKVEEGWNIEDALTNNIREWSYDTAEQTVSRYHTLGTSLMHNAETGQFPDSKPVEQRAERFTPEMRAKLKELGDTWKRCVVPFGGNHWANERARINEELKITLRTNRPEDLDAFGRPIRGVV